jgi:hypothetical protein
MSVSPNLQLPYLMPGQAQKHVTHNEALRALDAMLQLSVLDRDRTAPPGTPSDGDRYLVAANPSGAWAGNAGKIAAYQDDAWAFYTPRAGWRCFVADEAILVVFDGSAWVRASWPSDAALAFDATRTVLQFTKASGVLWEVAASAMADAVPFTFNHANYLWTNGPTGQTEYNDDVFAFGFNINGPNSKIVSGQPAFWISFERKFYQGGRWLSEFHLSHSGTDNNERRLISFLADHDGTWANMSTCAVQVVFEPPHGVVPLQFDFSTANQGRIFIDNSTRLQMGVNNVPWGQQRNAAGTAFIELPFINNSNQLQFGAGAYVVNGVAGTPCFDALPLTLTAGQSIFRAQGALTSAGSIDVLNAVMSVNGGLRAIVQNNGDYTNAGAELRLHALYGRSGCDTKLVFENFGVGGTAFAFAMGIDQSAGAWKLSASNGLGANDRITVDANAVAMGLPIRAPSYTVAGLPSASTTGAGAVVYVSNEAGGAVLAFSDGADWRRVTDRAVVS